MLCEEEKNSKINIELDEQLLMCANEGCVDFSMHGSQLIVWWDVFVK